VIFLLVAGYPNSLLNFRGSLIDALMAHGLAVHVAAPDLPTHSEIRYKLEAKGVQVHEIPLRRTGMNPLADFVSLISLWRLMRRIRPDCMFGYTIKPVIYGSLAAWLARVPRRYALITGLGYAFQEAMGEIGLLKQLVQVLYRFSLSKICKVFFQNPDDQALFRSLGIMAEGSASVVVNGSGVDVANFAQTPLPGTPRFLMIARLLIAKGVRQYAHAAAIVKSKYPQAEFGLVGWIDDNPDAITQAELDVWVAEGSVVYLGRLSDVRQAIADCSVYVLPSYREGTPRTVLEAMAMGRAVITTDAPGCREPVTEGDNGFLVSVKAVDELAAAMVRFIEQPELISSMGQRSREIAVQKYDVHRVNNHMLSEMGIM